MLRLLREQYELLRTRESVGERKRQTDAQRRGRADAEPNRDVAGDRDRGREPGSE